MANIRDSLAAVVQIDGVEAAALIDLHSGATLGSAGGSDQTEIEAAANIDLFKAKMNITKVLGRRDGVEEFLITTWRYYIILRQVVATASASQPLLLFVKLRRHNSGGNATNLAMTKLRIRGIEEDMIV